jgi:hypothetical protein
MGNRVCIFCGERADSKEHLYPDWILQTLEDRRPFQQKLGNGSYRTFSGEMTVRCVCSNCNSGWMSTLENSLIPLMKPMMLGESTLLDELQRRQLAVWAVKTVMVSEGTRPSTVPRFYSSKDTKNLQLGLSFPELTNIWLSRLSTSGLHVVTADLLLQAPIPEKIIGCVSTIVVGQLVFQVATLKGINESFEGMVSVDSRPGDWDRLLIQIWPAGGVTVLWPPAMILKNDRSERSLRALQARWEPRVNGNY